MVAAVRLDPGPVARTNTTPQPVLTHAMEMQTAMHRAILDSGPTQTEIARRCEVAPARISEFLRGEGSPNLITLAGLCVAVGKRWTLADS